MQDDRPDMVRERFFNPLDRDPFFLVGKSPFLRVPGGRVLEAIHPETRNLSAPDLFMS
jgi:hypothetical protein